MDVGCFGPFSTIFSAACAKYQRTNSRVVNRYNICSLACKAYLSAIITNNIRKFSEVNCSEHTGQEINQYDLNKQTADVEMIQLDKCTVQPDLDMVQPRLDVDMVQSALDNIQPNADMTHPEGNAAPADGDVITDFLARLRRHLVSLNLEINQPVINLKKSGTLAQADTSVTSEAVQDSPKPGPSGKQKIILSDDDDSDSDSQTSDDEKCCVCLLFQSKELKHCLSAVFTKWGACDFDGCNHWTHLKYCCDVSCLLRSQLSPFHPALHPAI
ncbi:hypothetical protein KUTeg_000927 [Tegillarca granosa]|uniref:Uncharacterized protein n=1 Tax=Tegillarca granosa TaxID=220873 RepID=A0ABQ9FW96_TEGGR|nr:hypothetical protein KUTeg_000927 [Tegillarca granosa]